MATCVDLNKKTQSFQNFHQVTKCLFFNFFDYFRFFGLFVFRTRVRSNQENDPEIVLNTSDLIIKKCNTPSLETLLISNILTIFNFFLRIFVPGLGRIAKKQSLIQF